ncbi:MULTISPECIES: dTDP-4-dehydrorhamnose 3,5-epimerase [unclassified Flavobacterium]|uniref:dTDP-4-dehydrorhamnose 3,5-epimerase n=1 Tax=unclassified Flavobacterium TaxID=196869 RepID=UPI001F14572D|nr:MULTISPECIES: dTDP-4-dehydrorhamnose 3,5-epimerase [unclassified Flavobacterium]UMY66381.1 dTDP-4-dehydrorhamnose 3,5-epimerase [Flavobacterium sp. HJ-32-4]
MKFTETKLKGCYILEPTVFDDGRGWFMESYNQRRFNEGVGQDVTFVQDNQSFSTKAVIRGLHFQTGAHAQAKLVQVLRGEVLDVAVDLRPDSSTFGHYESVVLSGENRRQFFVPRGFAHGFQVLSETAVFFYKCDNFYNKESEGGVRFDDPTIAIKWHDLGVAPLISDKDEVLPVLEKARAVW